MLILKGQTSTDCETVNIVGSMWSSSFFLCLLGAMVDDFKTCVYTHYILMHIEPKSIESVERLWGATYAMRA